MKKRNILTIVALLFTLLIYAQQSTEARALLDNTYSSFEASKGIRLTFHAATIGPDGSEQMSMNGTAFIRGDKFRLETNEMDIWFDGATQWVLMKEVNEVNISNPTAEEITSVSPLALLGIYRSGYILSAPEKKNHNGKSMTMIRMLPAAGTSAYSEVDVLIDSNKQTLVQVTLTLRNGTKQLIEISDYDASHNYSDREFRFDKTRYPHVEIIDLR